MAVDEDQILVSLETKFSEAQQAEAKSDAESAITNTVKDPTTRTDSSTSSRTGKTLSNPSVPSSLSLSHVMSTRRIIKCGNVFVIFCSENSVSMTNTLFDFTEI